MILTTSISMTDPFEPTTRNVAGTVTRLKTIKNEFVRAHTIVPRIQRTAEGGWEWKTKEGDVGESRVLALGDTLKLSYDAFFLVQSVLRGACQLMTPLRNSLASLRALSSFLVLQ